MYSFIHIVLDPFFGSIIGMVIFCIFVTMVLSAPAWWLGKRRNYFHPIEIIVPVIPFLVWYGLGVFLPDRGKTLANLIELPILGAVAILLNYFKLLVFSKRITKLKAAFLVILALNCIAAACIYFLIPELPV
jgi:hypothetical protein